MINMYINALSDLFTTDVVLGDFILTIVLTLIVGLALAWLYSFRTQSSKGFAVTLSIIPSIVCVVIMMVNGSIGTGIAVAGAFSLIRFRSVPGTAKEIGAIFIAMAVGIAAGTGYLLIGIVFGLMISLFVFALSMTSFGECKYEIRTYTVTIPEDLEYTDIFTDLFAEYTVSAELTKVRSTNMGSMFKLTYDIDLKDNSLEKEFIDKIRCRNGNLEVVVSKKTTSNNEL